MEILRLLTMPSAIVLDECSAIDLQPVTCNHPVANSIVSRRKTSCVKIKLCLPARVHWWRERLV